MQRTTGNIQANNFIQLDLFAAYSPEESQMADIKVSPVLAAQARANKAIALIKSVAAGKHPVLPGHPMVVAFSAGKDSSSVLNLALIAMKELVKERRNVQPLVILHADTLVENPEMAAYAHQQMESIKAYAEKHNGYLQNRVENGSLPNPIFLPLPY